MKHDLADKWGERLLNLEAQLEREPANVMVWHWRGEIRVLRFLLRRYGHTEPPAPVELILPDDAAADAATPPTSALERSLLRLALLIPNVATKHSRPAPQDRAEILERIKIARDEGREIEAAEESWWEDINAEARRKALRLREREEQWNRRECERLREEREKRRRR